MVPCTGVASRGLDLWNDSGATAAPLPAPVCGLNNFYTAIQKGQKLYKIPFHTLILSYNNVRLNTSPPHDDSSNAFLDFELKKPISGKQVNVNPKSSQAQDLVNDPARRVWWP